MPSQRFTKSQRVRRREEFQRVFDSNYKVSSRYFTLLFAPGGSSTPRLGIVASRKLGDAVRRNRAKRLIREVFRRLDLGSGTPVDLVVIPRRELFDAPFADLDRDFRAAWRRGRTRVQPAGTR
jgi:ribonuclease P protein component